MVLANGVVPLCHEDILSGEYSFGNAKDENVIDIFNNELRNKVRQEQISGNKNNNPKCRECTVHYSEPLREFVHPEAESVEA